MIVIKNTQRTIHLDVNLLRQDVSILLDLLRYSNFDIGIWITTDKTIRDYNKNYRNKDKATDILSFSFWPDIKPNQRIKAKSADERNLGDLIISAQYVQKAAKKLNISTYEHLINLIIHGICHLLGYDHIQDTDYRAMRQKEAWLAKKLLLHRNQQN